VGLDQSLQNDEIFSVEQYIEPGPDGTLFGDYEPNDHVLFNLVTWITTLGLGRSEALYRLWSVLPGMAAVGLLAWWSWKRLGAWVAVVFSLLAVAAPNHLELFKQARGYGLVALAGAAMLVASDRVEATGSRRSLAAWAAAAFVGVYTHFAIALAVVGQAAVIAARRELRRGIVVAFAIVVVVSLVGYAPLLGQIISDFQDFYVRAPEGGFGLASSAPAVLAAVSLDPAWHSFVSGPATLVAPITELAVTGDVREECEIACFTGRNLLFYAGPPLALGLVGSAVLWLRGDRRLLLLLAGPMVFAYAAVTIFGIQLEDRFFSYMVLWALVLVAVGIVALVNALGRIRYARPLAAACVAVSAVVLLSQLMDLNSRWVAVPWENAKGAGQVVNGTGLPVVVTNSNRSLIFEHYVGERLEMLPPPELDSRLCSGEQLVYIEHFIAEAEPADRTCLARSGASLVRVPQRGRGGRIDVWILPKRSAGG
jgi:hypothetical protein